MVPFLSLKKQGLNLPWCPKDFVVELQEASPVLITTAAKANFSLFIVVKYSFRKGLLQKRLSKIESLFRKPAREF
jgi:hypothetical protein